MFATSVALLLASSAIGGAAVTVRVDETGMVSNAGRKQVMRSAARDGNDNDDDDDINPPTAAAPAKTSVEHSSTPAKSTSKVVDVDFYYETKCPDSLSFINGTLAKMWSNKDIRPFLNVRMNPYGNAMSVPLKNVSEGYKFWHPEASGAGWEYAHLCQHGPEECLGNLVQACAIDSVDKDKYMDLVFCMAAKPTWGIEKSSYECMTSAGISQKPVKDCVSSSRGNKLLAEFGKRTQEVKGRTGTPWVVINGAHMQETEDLMQHVCAHLLEGGPSSCSLFKSKPKSKPKLTAPAHHGVSDDFTVLQKSSHRVPPSPSHF